MRITLFCLMLVVGLMACQDKKPNTVLGQDKMQAVLTDLYIAEAYSTYVNDSLHQVRNRNMDSLAGYYKTILSHHNISREQLNESVAWYKKNPEELDSVYAKIIPEISRLQAAFPGK